MIYYPGMSMNRILENGEPMKDEGASRRGKILYRVLLGIAAVLALILFAGTLYALVFRPGRTEPPSQTLENGRALPSADAGVFTGIGRLRAVTAGPELATVILSVVFPYPPNDKPFTEELVSQITNFRNVTLEYIAALPAEELRRKDEALIKVEILRRYNLLLRLGQIETLYFNEYLVIE
jgi:flagellar basal body-associated protein FliL